jgi:2-polyprenyl-3-methyl-5-hydroxy-6-metoxy-1,4-benzoquinol methylase
MKPQKKDLKSQTFELYRGLGFRISLYIKIRWLLCPYLEIEDQISQSATCLDVGCGFGLLSNLLSLSSQKRYVIGIDIDNRRIETAQKTIGDRENIEFICQDLFDIKKESFNVITFVDVLHHISNEIKQRIIEKSVSLLSPEGKIIIKDITDRPRWKYFYNYLFDNSTRIFKITKGNRCAYLNAQGFQKLLKNHGLHPCEIRIRHQDLAPHCLIMGSKI